MNIITRIMTGIRKIYHNNTNHPFTTYTSTT